uniref:Uncharacterized protein n=1 Tax=Nelumbo nucifera TaxID=4432 RepID=A0A822ZMF3_NELNU|nr:TPA_asm: hypothetical protein HUJ06_004317 [Nelumbo nucifera]
MTKIQENTKVKLPTFSRRVVHSIVHPHKIAMMHDAGFSHLDPLCFCELDSLTPKETQNKEDKPH